MHVEECRSCGAKVVWAKHEATGKPAPIDAGPVEYGGNVILNDDGTYRLLKKGEPGPAGGKRHKSHFATCPNHQQHRKAES